MSKVSTFSTVFPSYHPRKGEKTFFVEKIYESLYPNGFDDHFYSFITKLNPKLTDVEFIRFINSINTEKGIIPKHHTIRAGHRFKVGDKFSPRIWSGKPYHSKQIIIAPDIEVKKVWDIIFDKSGIFWLDEGIVELDFHKLSSNDGLELQDFLDWFPKPKKYIELQIICWNENINY